MGGSPRQRSFFACRRGLNDGKGLVFINCRGEAFPSRDLPLSCGDITRQSLGEVYRDSSLFVSLREVRG